MWTSKMAFFTMLLLSLTACSKKFTADKLPEKRIQFGTIGGFTGRPNAYVLLENGQIFKQKDIEGKSFESVGKIKSGAAKTIYKSCASFANVKMDKAGDLSHFITIKNENAEPITLQWPSSYSTRDSTVNALLNFHETLLKVIPLPTSASKEKE